MCPTVRLMLSVILVLGVAVGSASAAVFEGQQTDPAGDSVITPGLGGESFRGMDLTGASVRYDSDLGELRVTYTGDLPVNAHQGTSFSGRISSIAGTGGCGSPSASSDLTFTGETHSGSTGGVRLGSAELEGPLNFAGAVVFPAEGVVTFVFSGSVLAGRDYRCARDLTATWINSENVTNEDGIGPFCIVAGCFDPPAGTTPPPIAPSTVVSAQSVQPDARCSILPGKIAATTARMRFLQLASHRGSASHRRAVTRQARVLALRRTTLRATDRALCASIP
jgi:hypothetical protein